MSVIPITIALSLLLVVTFVVFFLRIHARSLGSSPERDSLLPFLDEKPAGKVETSMVISFKDRPVHAHRHSGDPSCSNPNPDHERCPDCPSRRST